MKVFLPLTGLLMIFQVACTPKAAFESARWDGEGPLPSPPPGVTWDEKPLDMGAKSLVFSKQILDGVEIEGAYYKKISGHGRAEFVDYRWMSEVPLSVRRDLVLMRAQKPFVLSYFLKSHEVFTRASLVEGPQLSLQAEDLPQVLWKLVFEKEDGTLWAFFIDRDMRIISQKRLGSEFIEARARIFPEGPLRSQLQEVWLRGLLSSSNLSSKSLLLTTEADALAFPGDANELSFTESDVRFSQVQVFYYITQALEWLKSQLSFELPFVLEVETQKGYPEKTNTAFYFQKKVRLGEGDGDVYEKIPMDPSIVTHESMHAVIEAVAGLPYEGQGGSLNEAFADFLTASQLKNPRMGEAAYKKASYKRTIENSLKLQDLRGALYYDSGIVSGLLWGISKKIGSQDGLRIAWLTLLRLNYWSDFATFKKELLAVLDKENEDTQKKAMDELRQRGWLE